MTRTGGQTRPDVARVFTAASGQVWQLAATGDFFGGARDGLVLVQSLNSGNLQARMIVYLFDPASGWAQNYSQDLGATFQGLAAGDVDGDRADELTGIRSGSGYNQILSLTPAKLGNNVRGQLWLPVVGCRSWQCPEFRGE